jgi:TPR repeat protein
LAFIAGLLASLVCAHVQAQWQDYKPFPGDPIDQRTRNLQERVEELYAGGNYARALYIYENELAPIGDKYAQYMVGFMHLNAQGAERDEVEALAWYRLAAERGERALEKSRNDLAAKLTPQQVAKSDFRFRELWRAFGDRALILELIDRDMEVLGSQTGTRITGSTTNSPTLVLRRTGEQLGPEYYVDIRRRLASRLAYLNGKVEVNDEAIAEDLARMRQDESRIRQELASLDED